ncbi:MAG TPA: oxidoreductase [Solirubrobacterales bacterium]|jgi:NAD(P)-dependent dehydrogenase (short-subunit alcohol dehydrogenase family)|nr:SDR family NAD(P)-dependent oxidoreductase [Solirubrobacterales bacterium]HMU27349.1 oxidoreductase [Solirubrobacterales bacterium]HMW45502.1 oxidoreductase [Solirubrobacterales bacterium]HMX71742.1 oxidoreductase [Solirubrobacterales bacterium]HNA44440.1 oxidoreductase [Solirubrobacterales bacterium]
MSKGWNADDITDQTGRTAIVTGGNSGIGLITARELLRHGARVIIGCRNEDKGKAAIEQIASDLGTPGIATGIEVRRLDLASLDSVREFAESVDADLPDGLDLLINNAGVMAPPRLLTEDNFELQFGTNHLGHFALTGRLFDTLKRKQGARIVTISSVAATMGKLDFDDLQSVEGYNRWRAYGQSKLANLVFAMDLQSLIRQAGLDMASIAAHPGVSNTNLTAAGNDLDSGWLGLLSKPFLALSDLLIAQDAAHGALPTLFAATEPGLTGGEYIGPDGLRQYRGSPTIVAPRRLALDSGTGDRLWKASTELTGVEYDFSPASPAA